MGLRRLEVQHCKTIFRRFRWNFGRTPRRMHSVRAGCSYFLVTSPRAISIMECGRKINTQFLAYYYKLLSPFLLIFHMLIEIPRYKVRFCALSLANEHYSEKCKETLDFFWMNLPYLENDVHSVIRMLFSHVRRKVYFRRYGRQTYVVFFTRSSICPTQESHIPFCIKLTKHVNAVSLKLHWTACCKKMPLTSLHGNFILQIKTF